MALQTFKPTSPGRRSMVRVSTAGLHKGGPLESLTGFLVSRCAVFHIGAYC